MEQKSNSCQNQKSLFDEIFTFKALFEELVYGSIAGVAICLGGHPFDTLKTRMQMEHGNLMPTLKGILKKEGPLAFYKGIAAPMASIPLLNAINFSSYEITKQSFELYGAEGFWHIAIAGGISGLISSVIVCPTELIKCKMQMQKNAKVKVYQNSWDCFLKIYQQRGIRGTFQGTYATVVREVLAYAAQFTSYEYLKREIFVPGGILGPALEEKKQEKLKGTEKQEFSLGGWRAMLAGAIAASSCWFFSFPPDVVKTRIQCAEPGAFKTFMFDGGFWHGAQVVYKETGLKGFFYGFDAILGRAMIGNAIGFWAWETSRQMIGPRMFSDSK